VRSLYEAWLSNSLSDWGTALTLLVGVWFALVVARMGAVRLVRAAARREGAVHGAGIAEKVLEATWTVLLLPLGLYAGASALELPARLDRGIDTIVVVALLLQVTLWIHCAIAVWLSGLIEKRRGVDGEAVTILALLKFVAHVVVWTFALLLVLNHLNFNITALVTGLGIGGVAVALALQNILGDLFASLSIVLDKPFVIGDFIVVGDYMGAVERIGLKTTRLRSLSGELIVCSNADLLKSRIRNYQRMVERRVEFTINASYDTPADKLREIPRLLRDAVEAQQPVRFERAHFKAYGESALVFEVAYHVLSADHGVYMDIQQAINIHIFRRFALEDIHFAYPTRTLHVQGAKSPARDARLALAGDRS
jgi:small-conductance mechanosensitive channel